MHSGRMADYHSRPVIVVAEKRHYIKNIAQYFCDATLIKRVNEKNEHVYVHAI